MCGFVKEGGLLAIAWLRKWICGKEIVCVCVVVGCMRSKKEVNVYICKRENKKRYGVLVQYTPVEYYKITIRLT